MLSAIEAIYSELEYTRNLTLVKNIYDQNYKRHHPDFKSQSGIQSPVEASDDEDDDSDDEDDYDDEDSEECNEEKADLGDKLSEQDSKKQAQV